METITPEVAISHFETHLKKAEIAPEMDITELYTLAQKAKALVDIDITDDAKMKEVASVRKELVSARRKIQADGLSARDYYTKTAKGIKQVEDVLIGIISEDEDRLKEFERQRKEKDIKEERLKSLPQRQLLLTSIGDGVEVSDDEILLMDDATFLNYVTNRQVAKAEAEAFAEEARQAEQARQEAEKQRIAEAEERARLEAENKAKAEAEARQREADAEIARLKAEAEAKEIARQKEIADAAYRKKQEEEQVAAQIKAEAVAKEKMEAEAKYQQWLCDNNYNPETDIIQDMGIDVVMYRKVAVYSKEI